MKKLIASLLTIAVTIGSISVFAKDYANYPQKFWDVPKTHWAFEAVSELVDRNVINGYEDGSFKPDRTVDRSEWAKMMVLAAGLKPGDSSSRFSDTQDHWANRYINAAVEYLAAYKDGSFKPDQAAAREDVTVSMVKLKGYDINDVDYSALNQFKDVNSISNDLKKYVAVAVEKGLISGFEDNTFRGQDTLTRAEAATILRRAFQIGNDNKVVDNKVADNSSSGSNSGVNNPVVTPAPKPTPTEKPAVTPEPTKKPEPAKKPEPTKEPEEVKTPEPEPEPVKKPYKVETLAKVKVTPLSGGYSYRAFYTQDTNDNLYYYDNDTHDIVKINMITREAEILANSDTLAVTYNDVEYTNMSVNGLFYDNYVNSLAVYGSFRSGESSFEHRPEPLYCIVELDTLNVVTFGRLWTGWLNDATYDHPFKNMTIYGTLENGDYLTNETTNSGTTDWLLNRNYDSTVPIIGFGGSNSSFYAPYQEYNGSLYFIGIYGGLYQYDYKKETKISDLPFWGLVNNKGYVLTSTTSDSYAIIIHKITGEFIKDIVFDDIEIMDKNRLIPNNINQVLLASTNDDIVFYDTWMKAFRIISENE